MTYEPKQTPPSGLPTASLLNAATPPKEEEISAPKSDGTVRRAVDLLALEVHSLRSDFKEHADNDHRHFGAIERQLQEQREDYKALGDEVVKLASAMTGVAAAAARAADHALEAKQQSGRVEANVQAMVESAMRMQNAAIGVAVAEAVKPFADEVKEIKSGMKKGNEALGAVVEQLGLEDRVELGRHVQPDDPRPVPTLPKMSRETKVAALAGTIAVVFEAIRLAKEMLGH